MGSVVVIGAGAIGCSTAMYLAQMGHDVTVLEKEAREAVHQSGRNSGVLHAGYNLKPGSDKARYCVEGNRAARRFCGEHDVAIREGGILVVARTEEERAVLAELRRRAEGNGVRARMLDEAGIKAREPHAAGIEALLAEDAASWDAAAFVAALRKEAESAGATFRFGERALRIDHQCRVRTRRGPMDATVVVNAAGLHADRIAAAEDMRIIPFRGFYAELVAARRDIVQSHIYAAPDLAFPFLGVHLSKRTDGRVLVGPGAMLAFGREAYHWAKVNPRDFAGTLAWPGFWRMMKDPRMRRLARSEFNKSVRLRAIANEARLLLPELKATDLVRGPAGNRAQMVDRTGRLVDDIVVRETDRAVHVLNAVSPGLTCSLPFGRYLAERAASKL